MGKLKYTIDGRGVAKVTATAQVGSNLLRVEAKGAANTAASGSPSNAWAQLTLDLFDEVESKRNGTSERRTE